jgi:phage baseplate assembly protein W
MATLKKIYSDIDLTFNRSPVTGDIAISYDNQAVIRSVSNLLLTNHFERPFQPGVGSNLEKLLFENVTLMMEGSIAREIEDCITNYEPRVKLNEVTVSASDQENGYNVKLSFFIGNNTAPTSVNLLLQRTR